MNNAIDTNFGDILLGKTEKKLNTVQDWALESACNHRAQCRKQRRIRQPSLQVRWR